MYASVSDQPTCPAAASHVAASAIHPYPAPVHVLAPVTMGYTVEAKPAIVLHALTFWVQKSPVVAAVQVRVPHTQLSALANDPSVTVHGANALHRLIARWQCGPAVVHSAEPQEQSPALAEEPSVTAQDGLGLQGPASSEVSQ